MDSIRGFGSLDPGSNPGTSACFDPRAYKKIQEKQHKRNDKGNDTMKNNTKKMILNRNGDWFVEHGYTHPNDIIDHNGNLDNMEGFFGIFAAYNQHHLDMGTQWDTWPDWELCLTSLENGLHFLEEASVLAKAEMNHWLMLAQHVHDSPYIAVDGYTISVQGQHETMFSFDVSLDLRCWIEPGAMAEHDEWFEAGMKPESGNRMVGRRNRLHASKHLIGHSLGSYWTVPEHVPFLGGTTTHHMHDDIFCLEPMHESLPLAMQSLLRLCREDSGIWVIQAKADFFAQIKNEWWEKHWPQGIPEDLDCQYSKQDWKEIEAEWAVKTQQRYDQVMNIE